MPQASPEQRALMQKWFGNPISETGPMLFLVSHGYILTDSWNWKKPTLNHTVSEFEWECMKFLIMEWDFGGVEPANAV